MFAGLKLDAGRAPAKSHEARETFAGEKLPASERPAPAKESERDRLLQASEGYAKAFSDAARMGGLGLPIVEHQKQALEKAGAALDAIRPELRRELQSALRHDPQTLRAMNELQGPERAARLVVGMERERQAQLDPNVRAARLAAQWNGLEQEHSKLRGWDQREAREKVEPRCAPSRAKSAKTSQWNRRCARGRKTLGSRSVPALAAHCAKRTSAKRLNSAITHGGSKNAAMSRIDVREGGGMADEDARRRRRGAGLRRAPSRGDVMRRAMESLPAIIKRRRPPTIRRRSGRSSSRSRRRGAACRDRRPSRAEADAGPARERDEAGGRDIMGECGQGRCAMRPSEVARERRNLADIVGEARPGGAKASAVMDAWSWRRRRPGVVPDAWSVRAGRELSGGLATGNADRWQAGRDLMRAGTRAARRRSSTASRLMNANVEALQACAEAAKKTGKEQKCSVVVQAPGAAQ